MRSYTAFAQYYDALTKNVAYEYRAKMLHQLIETYLPQEMPDSILLDLACGTGSLSEELAKRGWDVIGVDGSMCCSHNMSQALRQQVRDHIS